MNKNLYETGNHALPSLIIQALQKEPLIKIEQQFSDFIRDCNLLCANYLYYYLTAQLSETYQNGISIDELKKTLKIRDEYENFFYYMLTVVKEENLLKEDEGKLFFVTPPSHLPPPQLQHLQLKKQYPKFRGTLDLLHHCAIHYPQALAGDIPGISVLYPEGNTEFLDKILAQDEAKYTNMPSIRKVAVHLITHLGEKQPLRILEVGGGRGMITKELLSSIKDFPHVKYHFTDIGRKFILAMQKHVQSENYNFVTCSQFDISKNPKSQGLEAGTYDIILALDVVHAVQDITESLNNLKLLLKNNGLICLLETVHIHRWENLIMGLTKGWWHFNDQWRKSTALISVSEWQKALQLSGFTFINANVVSQDSDSTLIIASP